jgi:hypothetical protein
MVCKQPPRLLLLLTRGPWPEIDGEQGLDGRVSARGVAGGEVRGKERAQELTVVRKHQVSRVALIRNVDLDENPRWWRRGLCRLRGSGDRRRWRVCA